MTIASVMRNLAQFIVPVCFPFFLAPSAATTRPGIRDNSPSSQSANRGPVDQHSRPGAYDQWEGEYNGSCEFNFEGKIRENTRFVLRILKPAGEGELGFIGGFDKDLKTQRVTGVRFEIHLPKNLKDVDSLRVSNDILSTEHTQRCPYKADITKTTDSSGQTMLSGSIVGYQIGPGGASSSVIVMDVRSFRVTR